MYTVTFRATKMETPVEKRKCPIAGSGKTTKCVVLVSIGWLALFLLYSGGIHQKLYRLGKAGFQRVISRLAAQPSRPVREQLAALPPAFVDLLVSLHESGPQKGSDGNTHKIDALVGVRPSDGLLIYELCRRVKPAKTLEIGFAYGVSTLYFLAAIKANGAGHHTAVDPFEITHWHGIGLTKVKEVGMENHLRFIPAMSYAAFVDLVREGQKFEVIFIDGGHLFDNAFMDFTLGDLACPKGGHILIHDPWMASVSKVVAFIEKNRRDYSRQPSSAPSMAVFVKTGEDQRIWTHFKAF